MHQAEFEEELQLPRTSEGLTANLRLVLRTDLPGYSQEALEERAAEIGHTAVIRFSDLIQNMSAFLVPEGDDEQEPLGILKLWVTNCTLRGFTLDTFITLAYVVADDTVAGMVVKRIKDVNRAISINYAKPHLVVATYRDVTTGYELVVDPPGEELEGFEELAGDTSEEPIRMGPGEDALVDSVRSALGPARAAS